MGQKVLVTGGGGFLGGAIVKKLVENGDYVRSFSRNFYPELETMGVTQIRGDIHDKNLVEASCKDIDLVFHAAAKTGVWGRYSDYYKTNVTGTLNIISGCRLNKIPRLVYTSSPSVIFDGKNMEGVDEKVSYPKTYNSHYPKTKAIAEQAVINASGERLKTIILRPHLIWGPGDTNLVPRILKRANRLIRVGNGKNLVDTIYINNAADAHILAAEQLKENKAISGKVYFISQDDPVYLWEMINNILIAGGLGPVKLCISKRSAWLIGALFEFIYKLFNISKEPQMTRFVANELATSHWFDIGAAKKDFGYLPKVSTEEGLRRLKKWLKKKNFNNAFKFI